MDLDKSTARFQAPRPEEAVGALEAPYEGFAGRTRHVGVHLPSGDRALRTASVVRGVNVRTHPELRAAALDDTLHRLEDGTVLRLPFVFHDPDQRKLAVVVPEGQEHTALGERARFLAEVAEDTSAGVPAYVLEAPVVYGGRGLGAFLRDGLRGGRAASVEALAAREAALDRRERELMSLRDELVAREVAVEVRARGVAELESALSDSMQRSASAAPAPASPDASAETDPPRSGAAEPGLPADTSGSGLEVIELDDGLEEAELDSELTHVAPGPLRVSDEALASLAFGDLLPHLEAAETRSAAVIELCRRAEPQRFEALFRAVRDMGRAELVGVFPALVALGEDAGDAWIDALGARKTFTRQAAVVGLGELRLRRAVVPLVHALQVESSDVWREAARVLGGFGVASARTLLRGTRDPRAPVDRLVMALAHVVSAGCETQVRAMAEEEGDEAGRRAAAEALELAPKAAEWSDAVRRGGAGASTDPVVAFSRELYAGLATGRNRVPPA